MKHQKELRWLIFLLGPIIILFGLHLSIPLLIKTTNHSLSEQQYRYDLMSEQKKAILSSHFCNHKTIALTTSSLFNQLNTILNIATSYQRSFITINLNSIQYTNAFLLANTFNNSNTTQNKQFDQFIWFASGKQSETELSSFQQQMLSNYQKSFPLIQPIAMVDNHSLIDSFSFYYVSGNDSLFIQYPAQFNQRFLSLNSPTLDNIYYQTLYTYQINNNISTTAAFYSYDTTFNQTFLLLCRPTFSNTSTIVACIKVNVQKLGEHLTNELRIGQVLYFSSEVYMTLSNDIFPDNMGNPQILLYFSDPVNNTFNIPQNSFLSIDSNKLALSTFNLVNNLNNQRVSIIQQNLTIWYVSPLKDIEKSSCVLHLVTKSSIGNTQLLPEEMKSNLNSIIIPVSLLTILFTFVNCCIMKKLLQSLDEQLDQLDERCKFIADGDINVQIPFYDKTKDMKEVYNRVRIINKLHRYSDQKYFTGHFSQKILRYNEALQLFKILKYDPGNLLQNIGQAYNFINDWTESISFYKQSIDVALTEIQEEFGSFDDIITCKSKKLNLPLPYRELQLILVRRLFKINFSYIRYFELTPQQQPHQSPTAKTKALRQYNKFKAEFAYYRELFKKAVYPNIAKIAEGLVILCFEVKQIIMNGNYYEAEMQQKKVYQLLKMYNNNYPKITKLLKDQKGSSHRLFFRTNKMTEFSRSNPSLLFSIHQLISAYRQKICNPSFEKYNKIVHLLSLSFQFPTFFIGTSYLTMKELWKTLAELQINVQPLETTEIFKQNMPFKTLHMGQVTEQNYQKLLRFSRKDSSKGLQRQYVLLFDCQRCLVHDDRQQKLHRQFFVDQYDHLFTKLIKPEDRISIIKFNTKQDIKIACNLTMKKFNEELLRNQINEAIQERYPTKKIVNHLFEAIDRTIWRIKHLYSEKVVIIFLKSIPHYEKYQEKSVKRKTLKRNSQKSSDSADGQDLKFDQFGDYLVSCLSDNQIKNLKIILYCWKEDPIELVRSYFGLVNINKRIWSQYNGLNRNNIAVYLIQSKHKNDIDRILMSKSLDIPDNNIFVL